MTYSTATRIALIDNGSLRPQLRALPTFIFIMPLPVLLFVMTAGSQRLGDVSASGRIEWHLNSETRSTRTDIPPQATGIGAAVHSHHAQSDFERVPDSNWKPTRSACTGFTHSDASDATAVSNSRLRARTRILSTESTAVKQPDCKLLACPALLACH